MSSKRERNWKPWPPTEQEVPDYSTCSIQLADGVNTFGTMIEGRKAHINAHHCAEGGSTAAHVAWDYSPGSKQMTISNAKPSII